MDINSFDVIVCTSCGIGGLAYPELPTELAGEAQDVFMAAGGFTRAGTELRLCRRCDPLDFDNLPPEVQQAVVRELRAVIELSDLGLSRNDALQIYLNAHQEEDDDQ